MAFKPDIDISTRERREFPRYTADRRLAVAVRIGTQSQCCHLADISLGGACLTFDRPPKPCGPDVIFEPTEQRPFTAEMCWQAGRKLGVRFDFSEEALAFVTEHLRAA